MNPSLDNAEDDPRGCPDCAPCTFHPDAVRVPTTGSWLVLDGVPVQVHEVRTGEADWEFNRCSPDDPCGAQDGCNT